MRWKLSVLLVLVLSLTGAPSCARAQVTYAGAAGKQPFTVGVGASNFSDDWGIKDPRQVGITLWVDWRIPRLPPVLDGLGLEFEGRDVNYATPSYLPGHRMDTALGGPIYQWRKPDRFRPFGKFLIGIGSIDFPNDTDYTHDTRTVFEPGGGADVRFWNRFSVRAEYDYQFWRAIFGPNDLNPNGFSIGAVYDFGSFAR
jgi:opacity protein-like surface antigen